jgi:c-di-GMP-binding flagellar brake protein YcgR
LLGEFWTVSNPFAAGDGPQPPKVLKAPLEVFAALRQLEEHRDPLIITFHERAQRFQTFIIQINRERGVVALDEMVPNDGERFLKAGESFRIEGFHEGVRIAWEYKTQIQVGQLEGSNCYWCPMPTEVLYHQRRNAYRAPLKQAQSVNIELSGDRLKVPVKGVLLDISATGCKLRFAGDASKGLQSGQVYERLVAQLPFGAMTTAVELRHLVYDEKLDMTFVGMRFHRMNGLEQRQIDRFVYQLQREARRDDIDD